MKIRGVDRCGSGAYLASRGHRLHQGVDIVSEPNEEIKSVCCGKVTKIGYPYNPQDPMKGWLRYVQVTDLDDIDTRVFYIDPVVELGDVIHKGQTIGLSQDLTNLYRGITQHYHFEVKKSGQFLNPMEYLNDFIKD